VVEGTYDIQRNHCLRYRLPWSAQKAQASAHEMYERIFCMKFLPPGRGLWMMGTPFIAEKGGAALNNCSFVSTENLRNDLADPFCFLMDMSMLGVGVGGDTKGAGTIVIRAPKLRRHICC
jgi:ribonucleoside-triphosphate reductase